MQGKQVTILLSNIMETKENISLHNQSSIYILKIFKDMFDPANPSGQMVGPLIVAKIKLSPP